MEVLVCTVPLSLDWINHFLTKLYKLDLNILFFLLWHNIGNIKTM
jgi:hypothetical protein